MTSAAFFYRPPVGLGVVLILAVVTGLVVLALSLKHERRWGLLVLRLVGLMALGWVLLGPSVHRDAGTGAQPKPELVLLVDRSASMAERDASVPGRAGTVTRLEALQATWLSEETRARLGAHARVRVVAFAERARPADPDTLVADGQATHLREAIATQQGTTTVLLSDGHDTQDALPQTAGAVVQTVNTQPLFAVPVGAARGAPDASVQSWAFSDRLFDGQQTDIVAQVYQRGFAGHRARVALMLDSEPVDTKEITLDSPMQQVRFTVSPGLPPREPARVHGYTCRVTVLDTDEAYPDNNLEHVFIQVTREKTRVLLLEGDPYWDTRSLSRLIGSHPDYDLTTVFALGDRRRVMTHGPESPLAGDLSVEALRTFDVIVLGRDVQRLLSPELIDALVPFVRDEGGAVVFARGAAFDASSEAGRRVQSQVSPVTPGEREAAALRLAVSEAARGNPLTDLGGDAVLSRLPGMIAATRVAGRRSASVVLLEQSGEGPQSAAITTMRVGAGVTMAVLTDGLWRWELLPQRLNDLDSVYAVFWTRALQWLASGGAFLPGQDASLTLDRLTAGPGEVITIHAGTRYADRERFEPEFRVIAPDGTATVLNALRANASGGYSAAYAPQQLGVHRVELTALGQPGLIDPAHPLTSRLAVVDRSAERRDTSARPEVLHVLAEATGGRCLGLDEIQPVIDYLREVALARQADSRSVYDFARWPVMSLVFGCFGLEWLLRRRGGLL